jgi:protoporphyrinogen oxidase
MVFTSSQSLSKYYWTNVNELHYPFLVFVQHTNLMPKEDYEGHHVYYIGTYVPHDHPYFAKTDVEIADEWFAGLSKVFPDFNRKAVEQMHLFRLKNAQHVVDCSYPQKIPDFRTPLPGIYLSNFSQIFPEDRGTNFAVRDGRRIASLLLSDLPSV